MRELKDLAAATGAQFEIYSKSIEKRKIELEDSGLREAGSGMSSGVSLRLLKDGRCGFSFTSNLTDPEALVDNAMASLRAGVRADYSFPGAEKYARISTFSGRAMLLSPEDLLAEAFGISRRLNSRCRAQVNSSVGLIMSENGISNSSGVDVSWRESCVYKSGAIVSPGGGRYIAGEVGFDLTPMPESRLDFVAELFGTDSFEVKPPSGKHNVLFMPGSAEVLLSRVRSGANGQSLRQNISPLAGKIGQSIFSEKITLRNNPLDDSIPGGRFSDDEGVSCSDFVLFDGGVFNGFYFDLDSATRTGAISTGHGFRRSAWGADPVALKPQPYLSHLCFDAGDKSFHELLNEMGNGIVVFGALGIHTGNIPNGDFSVGLSLGLCVEHGRITGRVKDTMLSGNIYDVLKRVVAVGSERDPYYHNNPPVLLAGVDVSN